MRKMLHWMFLLVLMSAIGTAQAQLFNYTCDFENETDTAGWLFQNSGANKWFIGTAVNNTANGTKALYVSSSADGSTYAYDNSTTSFSCAYRELTLEVGSYDILFDWKCMGEGTYSAYDFIRVALLPSTATIPASAPYGFNGSLPDGWIALDGGNPLVNDTSWTHVVGEVDVPTAGTYKLAFFWKNDFSGGSNPPGAIDGVVFKAQSCPKPANFVANGATSNSINLSWTETGSAYAWNIEYGPAGFAVGSGTSMEISENPYTLTNLTSNTLYDIYIKSVCSVDESSNTVMTTFRTLCGEMVLPFFDGFEACEDYEIPYCWFVKSGKAEAYSSTWSANTGEFSVKINKNGILYSPALTLAANEMGTYFAAKKSNSSAGDLEIGFVSDTVAWDYTRITTISPVDDDYHFYEVDLDAMEGVTDLGYIVFKQVGASSDYSGWYVDDVNIFQLGSCRAPNSFSFSNITNSSVTLNWNCPTSTANFKVKYNETIVDVNGTTTLTLNDLDANTVYQFSIRTVCDGTDSSYWQDMGWIRTEPLCASLLDLRVANVSTNTAAISWMFASNGNPHTNILLQYKLDTIETWTDVQLDDVNGYFITGLSADTRYNLQVSVICGQDTSSLHSLSFKTKSTARGEIVGNGYTESDEVPLSGYFKHSYTQTIYPGYCAEGFTSITGIQYNTSNHAQSRNISIYLANTDLEDYASADHRLAIADMTKVFAGTVNFSGAGWDSIVFTTPFVSDGRNLVVCVRDTTGSYSSDRVKFRYNAGTTIYKRQDYEPIDPDGGSGFYISQNRPDIRLIGNAGPVTCKAPVVAFTASDASSITFSWRTGLNETSWTVDYRVAGESEWTSFNDNTTDSSVVISGLLAGTIYEVRVGSLCSDDTIYAFAEGVTTCSDNQVPYFDSFESGYLNTCWTYGSLKSTSNSYPSIANDDYLYMPSASYLIMSPFEDAINTLQLALHINDNDTGAPLFVGVCTEKNNISTFVPVDTVYVDAISPDAEVIARLSSYEGEGQYIALKTGFNLIDIYDLKVETIPSCPKPIHIKAIGMGGSYANITWDNDVTANGWSATIVAHGGDIANGTTITCSENSVSFTDLTSHTAYDVYVSAVCGTSQSDANMITITTLGTDPLPLPYSTNFSDATENAKWTIVNRKGTNAWMIGNAISNGNANSLYVSNDGASHQYALSSNNSVSFAYIPITIPEDGMYAMTYDWQCDGEGTWDFARVAIAPVNVDFSTAPDSRENYNNVLPTGWIAMDNGNMSEQYAWQTVTKKQSLSVGTYFIVCVWNNDGSGGDQPPAAIDNLQMIHVTCPEPTGLVVSGLTSSSATVSWNPDEMATNGWEVKIGNADPVLVTDTFYTFDELNPGTGYTVTVRSNCGDESYSIVATISFFTECADIETLPFVANFDLEGNVQPHCWTSPLVDYPIIDNASLKFYCSTWDPTSNIISMPRIGNSLSLGSVEMSFRVKNDSYYASDVYDIVVGVCRVPGVDSTFTPIQTFSATTDWQEYVVSFNSYADTGRYITFKSTLGSEWSRTLLVDDVNLSQASPCGRPTNVMIDSYTHNSVTVSWVDTNVAATPKVAIGTVNDVTAATVYEEDVTSPYTITDLAGSTTYHVWVAANCTGLDAVSGWVYAGNVTTAPTCGAVTDIQVYDIDETHATISWRAPVLGEPVTDYIVSTKMNNNAPTVDTIQVPYLFLSNLSTDSNYIVTVTTLCDTVISANNTCSFVPEILSACNMVGNGTESTSSAPTNTNWNYTLSQMIYLSSEMAGMGDTISGVTFNRTIDYWGTPNTTRNVVVYMGMTDLTNCADGWIDTNQLTCVYRGAWNLVVGDCPINFTTPFIYNDHTKNLVVMVDDNTGSYPGVSSFYYTETEDYKTIYKSLDSENITISHSFSSSTSRPNIVFDATCQPITCFPPSIVVTALNDTSATLVWRAGGSETSWKVEYRGMNDADWTVLENSTTNTTVTTNNLVPGTTYTFRVGSICGSNVAYRNISFTTDCGAVPTPFKEDFTNADLGTFTRSCWYLYSEGWDEPAVGDVTGNGKVLIFSDNAHVIFPEVRGNLSNMQLRVRYLSTVDTAFAVVGYVSNPQNFSSFHPVDTIYDNNLITGTFHTVLFNTIPVDATGQVAISFPQDYAEVLIDDIIIEPIRACAEPTDVQVSNITATSADIAWNGTASSYVVEYGITGYVVRGDAPTTITAFGTSATINGLLSGTNYDVSVRAVCGNDTSYATNPVGFSTECAAITTLPYVMDFALPYLPPVYESRMVPNCWKVAYMEDTNSLPQNLPQIVSAQWGDIFANEDRHALRMRDFGILALPEMGVDIDTLCMRFYANFYNTTGRIVVGILDHTDAGCESTFTALDTIVPSDDDITESYAVYLHQYTGTGKYIAFKNIDADTTRTSSKVYIDSVVVDYIPSCPEVINLKAIAATSSTITIDWDDILAPAASYEVVYGEPGFILDSATTAIATAHPFVISNLEMLTAYEIWVRPICSATDTGVFCLRPIIAQTSICDSPVTSTTAPNGSTGNTRDYPFDVYRNYSYSQTIIDAAYITDQSDIQGFSFVASRESNGKLDGCNIYLGHTNKTKFANGQDWYPADSLTLVYSGNLNYEAGTVIVRFDNGFTYDGSSNLIIAIDRDAGTWQGQHYFDIVDDTVAKTLYHGDDYDNQDHANPTFGGNLANAHTAFSFISCGNGCAKPVLTALTDLTYESATINWTGAGTNYEVAIRPQDDPTMPEPTAVIGTTYTFSNLTPNVSYVYYVRQVCEEESVSDWAEGTFITDDLPCFVPTNLTVVSKTANTITLNWTAAEGQQKWAIRAFNTLENHLDTVTSKPGTITGLTGGFTYNVTVQAICATNYASDWSDTIEVTTSDCLPVNNVAVSEITSNSAKVTWTAGGSEANWQINYGPMDFGQGEGEIVESTTNSYTITGLESETNYDVYVRAMCTAEFASVWSEVVRFTTLEGQEGIDGVEGNFQFAIYPNPTSASTTISLQGVEGPITISVVDMNGRTVANENIECGIDCEKRIDVTNLAQGTYFVRVLGDNINSVRKLIVR